MPFPVASQSEKPRRPPKPYQWPSADGLLHMHELRDYARWLFPQLDREWASPGVRDFTLKPEVQGKKAEPYRFPKSKGPCFMRDLIHFAAYVIPALRASIQQESVTISDDFTVFREIQYGPQQPGKKDTVKWRHTTGLAFFPDARILDAFVYDLIKEKAEKGGGVKQVAL